MSNETKTEETCAQLIKQKLEDRAAYFEQLYDKMDDEDSVEDLSIGQIISEDTLEISKHTFMKILLSTGGPSDWIEVNLYDDGSIRNMSYHYADWFDHAETPIYNDSYLWQFAYDCLEYADL